MQDYTTNDFEKEEFILNYEKEDETIIINYASKRSYKTPYSKELEKYLLLKMKEQVLSTNIDKLKSNYLAKEKKNIFIWLIISLVILIVDFPILISVFTQCTLYILIIRKPRNLYNKKISDYQKNKLFIENIELFNKKINKELYKYYKLSKKATLELNKLIELKNNQTLVLNDDNILAEPTINTIEGISNTSLTEIYYLLLANEIVSEHIENNNIKKRTLTKN